MIPHFSDFSANERTYLAWIRTAISLMRFGFLIERFDEFLVYTTRGAVLGNGLHMRASEWLGLGMILLGAVLILLATRSFYRNCRLIQSETEASYRGSAVERVLTALLVALALFLVLYVGYQLTSLQ
jgi:putative membrane protein